MSKDNVYIFGNSEIGFHGHTYTKKMAKNILKHRKGFECYKIKYDDRCKEDLSVNSEFIEFDNNIYMTAAEEEYFIESFTNFQNDVVYRIRELMHFYKYFKLSDKEKNIIESLLFFLGDYIEYMECGQYEDDVDDNEFFDNNAAMKYFIKTTLDK